MTTASGLQGEGIILDRPVRTTGTGKDGKRWELYKFKVSMPDGEQNFQTWKGFADDLQAGQRVSFVYSTKPNTWIDRDTGEPRENTQYQMDTLIPPDPNALAAAPQNEREAGEQMQQEASEKTAEAWRDHYNSPPTRYEGWQIGQSWNLASIYIGARERIEGIGNPQVQRIEHWWEEIERAAAFILPRVGREPMASQPTPEAPDSPAQANIQGEGPMYDAEGNELRVFANRGEFSKAAYQELGMNTGEAWRTLALAGWTEITRIEDIDHTNPDQWLTLVNAKTEE